MRELPEPYGWFDIRGSAADGFTRDQVLAIQKQAYEDGLRDAAAHARNFLTSGRSPLGLSVESAILSMLTASQKPRCELCGYQHGHAIGCANNPVDIALQAASQEKK